MRRNCPQGPFQGRRLKLKHAPLQAKHSNRLVILSHKINQDLSSSQPATPPASPLFSLPASQPVHQPASPPAKQPVHQLVHQPVSLLSSLPASQPVHQLTSPPNSQCTSQSTSQPVSLITSFIYSFLHSTNNKCKVFCKCDLTQMNPDRNNTYWL